MTLTSEELRIIEEALTLRANGLARQAGKEKNPIIREIRDQEIETINRLIRKVDNLELPL